MIKLSVKSYKIIVISLLILSIILMGIGVGKSSKVLYSDTGITVEHHTITSFYSDGISMEMNYIKPDAEKATTVGLILAHGFSNDRWWFQEFGAYAADLGIHVVAMDYRGHGLTEGKRETSGANQSSVEWQISSDQAANDLFAEWNFLHDLGCTQIYVGGHSMGGFCAARFSMKYPDLINGTILMGATYPFIGEDINMNSPKNLLLIIGSNEELFSQDSFYETLKKTTNLSDPQEGTVYGNFSLGTARQGVILTEEGKYIGHIDEPLHPLTYSIALEWISTISEINGIDLNFSNEFRDSIFERDLQMNSYGLLTTSGLLLFFFSLLICLPFVKIKSLKNSHVKKEIIPSSLDINSKFNKKLLLLIPYMLGQALFACLGFLVIKWTNLSWIPLSMVPYIATGWVFTGIFSFLILLMLSKFSKSNQKSEQRLIEQKSNSTRTFHSILINVGIGLFLSLSIPILFQIIFILFNLPNIIGDFPAKPIAILYWFILTGIIIVSFLPDEVILRSIQQKIYQSENSKSILIFNVLFILGKLLYFILISIGAFFLNVGLLTVIFIVALYLILVISQMIGIYVFKYRESITTNLIFSAVIVAWLIISFLPFYSP